MRIVFLALGDETRQLILLTLLEQELKELRDNEIAQHTICQDRLYRIIYKA
ncbi:hypothetical protein [Faecalicoccus pleomorphus]|uniref:hypothetical protein n=1 Tax=Faecalicoccus pleomorphus TaxID=1323 RepID=UPI00242CDAAC|nr:hypothetical protein [Faecalicoccus pleomorphus]